MLAEEMLAGYAQMYKRLGHGPCFHEWLLANGEACGQRIKIKGLPLMRQKLCFSNSMQTLWREVDHKEWFYTEGVVVSEDIPLLIDHAWLTNRKGEVLDRTLRWKGVDGKPRGTPHYYGIPFAHDYATKMVMDHGYYGLFSNGMMYNQDIVGKPVKAGRAWKRRKS